MVSQLHVEALEFSHLSDSPGNPLSDFCVRAPAAGPLSDASNAENQPHPLRIYTLGRFAVVKDGVLIAFSGRPQHKPMSLLKAALAPGGGDVGLLAQAKSRIDNPAAKRSVIMRGGQRSRSFHGDKVPGGYL